MCVLRSWYLPGLRKPVGGLWAMSGLSGHSRPQCGWELRDLQAEGLGLDTRSLLGWNRETRTPMLGEFLFDSNTHNSYLCVW